MAERVDAAPADVGRLALAELGANELAGVAGLGAAEAVPVAVPKVVEEILETVLARDLLDLLAPVIGARGVPLVARQLVAVDERAKRLTIAVEEILQHLQHRLRLV